ncbi:sulfotransferase 1B1-like [Haliotis asinina]|uniref:sulfotransferase 1B1-like n=1 Tax=Haliotis asinina TaxID=109174 RepID=UPI00353254A0
MSLVTLQDKEGHSMKVLSSNGHLFHSVTLPISYDEHLENIGDLEVRHDDVLFCAYPKSGTHWLWEVTNMVMNGRAEYSKDRNDVGMLDFIHRDNIDNLTSPRILNTHFRPCHLPRQVVTKKPKVILVIRHPKDIAVSYYNMVRGKKDAANNTVDKLKPQDTYEGKWKHFLDMFLDGKVPYGSWFDYIEAWDTIMRENPDLPVHVVRFEDMKKDPVEQVKKLANFLGSDIGHQTCEEIADACSFHKLKKACHGTKDMLCAISWKAGGGLFRKGRAGEWKNWFDETQNDQFDRVYNKKLSQLSYLNRYQM